MRGLRCYKVSTYRRGKRARSPKSRLVGGSRVLRCQIERCLCEGGTRLVHVRTRSAETEKQAPGWKVSLSLVLSDGKVPVVT